jgi:hypothetical protein
MECVIMHRAVYSLMIVLMVVWTALLVVDLAQSLLAANPLAEAGGSVALGAGKVLDWIRADLWSPAAQARAVVWGIPMVVFSLIAAIAQR